MGVNMRFAIDRINDNIVTLENIETKEIINVERSLLPKNIKEGNILIKKEIYQIDYLFEKERRNKLRSKLDSLK